MEFGSGQVAGVKKELTSNVMANSIQNLSGPKSVNMVLNVHRNHKAY